MGAGPRVIVIGAGITGLACAFRLKCSGIPVVLLEASDRPGGLIATFERNGFLFEGGPQCPRFSRSAWDLVRAAGLVREFVPADSRVPRYIVKSGRLHRAPLSPLAFVRTPLVGASSKCRFLTEALRRSRPPAQEESLAEFVHRKFGDEVLDYLVDPFISAIYAGDPAQIGVTSAFPFLARWEQQSGGLLRGALKSRKHAAQPSSPERSTSESICIRPKEMQVTQFLPSLGSFRTGLAALPAKIAELLGGAIRFRTKADRLERMVERREPRAPWRVILTDGTAIEGDAVVIAAPAYDAARVLSHAAPALANLLSDISYAPLAVISSGYDRSQVRHSLLGFGFMVPRREALHTFFNVWNSSLLPGRAPHGKILITSFAGGARDPSFVEQNEAAIAQIVDNETGSILGIDGPPVERCMWKLPRALPQFTVGHARRITGIRETQASLSGLYLAGNYFAERSIGECVDMANRVAAEIARQLGASTPQRETT